MVASPFAVAVAANFGVDDIKARTAGKVFQVLWFHVSPSPGAPVPSKEAKQGLLAVPETLRS